MKSYSSLDIIKHKDNSYVFRSDYNDKYLYGTPDEIKKWWSKMKKPNIYEYVDYSKPIRIFFNIRLCNDKSDFEYILDTVLKYLNFSIDDFIIIQEDFRDYRVVHKYLYINNYEELSSIFFNINTFQVNIEKKEWYNSILNNEIIMYDKYDFKDSLLNNVNDLLLYEFKYEINSETINSKYVNKVNFGIYNTIFIKSKMGSGKSTATVEYIKNNNIKSFLILSCRRTLTSTICDKLKEYDIDVVNYLNSKEETIKMSEKLIISPDSINKIDFPLRVFDLIWIDEGCSFMYYLGNCLYTNNKQNKNENIIIEWLLKNATNVLITDADLCVNSIKFYLYFRKINSSILYTYNYDLVKNKYEIYELEKDILVDITDKIKMQKNLYICCDTLSKTKYMYKFIIELDILNNNDILLYNSESIKKYDKAMYNVNQFWSKYKVVIVSPKVVFGVDYNKEYFDYVYGFYKCATLVVRESIQQLNRIRHIKNKIIKVLIYDKIDINKTTGLINIKYNIEINNTKDLFYKKTQDEIKTIMNTFVFNINKKGYKYLDMNYYKNYLLINCINEMNMSLSNFKNLFIDKIK